MRGDANNAIEAASKLRQGLDAKKNKTSPRRVKCFYLTSPFIEPAPPTLGFPERTGVALRSDLAHDNHQNSNFLFRLR
jgi:hypothetical protein